MRQGFTKWGPPGNWRPPRSNRCHEWFAPAGSPAPDQFLELLLRQYRHAQFFRLVQLAAGLFAGDHVVRLLRHAARRLAAEVADQALDVLTLIVLQRARDHERL